MKRSLRILATSIVLALSPLAAAQTEPPANHGQAQVAGRIAGYFTNLAGSRDNSLALVNALRTGTATTLTTTTPGVNGAPPTVTETSFTPPTRPMGWGNVRILLALAQDQLTRLGITNPTNEQLLAALNGGDVTANGTTTTLRGILQMRADGMGMGQIAHASGTKLGPVVSGLKKTAAPSTETTASATTTKAKAVTTAAGAATTKTTGKPEKALTTGAGSANSHGSRGLVTAGGAPTSGGSANAQGHGRGLVTAAGGGAGNTAATTRGGGHGQGQGIVNGGGNAAGSTTTAHGGGRGGGNGGGQGSGQGHGKGGKG